MRYFLFIDESGDANMQSTDHSFNAFVLCGILISEESYTALDVSMKDLKAKYFGVSDIVFHSVKMRNKKGVFKIFQAPEVLNAFREELHDVILAHPFKIIASVIDKAAYKERYPLRNTAYQESLKFMCERSVFCLRKEDDVSRFLIYLERRDSQDAYIKSYYTKHIQNGTTFMSSREMRVCEKKLHFRRKIDNIIGLELADLCAYPIARKHLSPESNHPLYEICKSKFYKSNLGVCEGYGVKKFP